MRKDSHSAWHENIRVTGGVVSWNSDGTVSVLGSEITQLIQVLPNTTYTLSFWLQYLFNPKNTYLFCVEYKDQGDTPTAKYCDHAWNDFPNTLGNSDKQLTFTTQPDCRYLKIYVRNNGIDGTFTVKNLKLERGNIATEWSPNYADYAMQSDLDALKATVDQLKSKLGG